MKMKRLLAAGLIAAAPAAALAHHGWSSYDTDRVLRLNGTFAALDWSNPHGMAKIRYRDRVWTVVLAPIARMEARGLTRQMIRPGQRITLVGYPKRDGSAEMRIERVRVGDKTVELR
jgi:uncharacterized protein DUF6152